MPPLNRCLPPPLTQASGVEEEDDSRLTELVASFRADCQLYEDYVRPEGLRPLPSKLCVLRGRDDDVVTTSEMCGWVDEFDCEEAKMVRVPQPQPGTPSQTMALMSSTARARRGAPGP